MNDDVVVKLLGREWKLVEIPSDNHAFGRTYFPTRIIEYCLDGIKSIESFKHILIHEITHAVQAEMGQWQNVLENGRIKDEFDSEFICEFVAINGEEIIRVANDLLYLYGGKEDGKEN